MYIKNRTDEEFIVRPLRSLALMRLFSPLRTVFGENRRPSGFVRLFVDSRVQTDKNRTRDRTVVRSLALGTYYFIEAVARPFGADRAVATARP